MEPKALCMVNQVQQGREGNSGLELCSDDELRLAGSRIRLLDLFIAQ